MVDPAPAPTPAVAPAAPPLTPEQEAYAEMIAKFEAMSAPSIDETAIREQITKLSKAAADLAGPAKRELRQKLQRLKQHGLQTGLIPRPISARPA